MPVKFRKTILVEDSNLVSLCWKIESSQKTELQRFTTPKETLQCLSGIGIEQDTVFVVDVDFAGLDTMDGIQFAKELRKKGILNPIHLYSGFVESIPHDLLKAGVISGIHSKEDSPGVILERILS